MVETESGEYAPMYQIKIGDKIKAFDFASKRAYYTEVEEIFENSVDLYEATTSAGKKIKASLSHKFMTESGEMMKLSDVLSNGCKIICES